MDKEVEDYIDRVSTLLGGQLRGGINKKAREENLAMIQLTMVDVWEKSEVYTKGQLQEEETLDKLKEALKDDNNGPET